MTHALIINDNMAVSRGIKSRLENLGFDSFDHTWSERQTLEAATRHRPDLIVVGDAIAEGSPIEVAKKVALTCDAPVLAVIGDSALFRRGLPDSVSFEGPFKLSDLAGALASPLMAA